MRLWRPHTPAKYINNPFLQPFHITTFNSFQFFPKFEEPLFHSINLIFYLISVVGFAGGGFTNIHALILNTIDIIRQALINSIQVTIPFRSLSIIVILKSYDNKLKSFLHNQLRL